MGGIHFVSIYLFIMKQNNLFSIILSDKQIRKKDDLFLYLNKKQDRNLVILPHALSIDVLIDCMLMMN